MAIDAAPQTPQIQYKPLHPTFVAEASGVDLTKPTPELVAEIKKGLAQVRGDSLATDRVYVGGR
jgi:hypothetical protein